MATLQFREALRAAMTEEMERDDNIFLIGEEVAEYNGAYKVSKGMLDQFGSDRVIDSPISELGFAGLGIGAAMNGLRPIVEFMTFNFSFVAFDQVINNAPNIRYMSGGQFDMPIVFRGPNGAAGQLAATHSNSTEALYSNFPGLKVVSPSIPDDGKGLLKTAIRQDDPVVFLESELMYGLKGEVSDEADYTIPLGSARVARERPTGERATVRSGERREPRSRVRGSRRVSGGSLTASVRGPLALVVRSRPAFSPKVLTPRPVRAAVCHWLRGSGGASSPGWCWSRRWR